MLARNKADLPLIKDEYQVVVRNTSPPQLSWMQKGYPVEFSSSALSKADFYTQLVTQLIGFGSNDTSDDQLNKARNTVLIALGAAALMFMLLPVINLVNINISRILDRSSEIGVRKSFGASSGHLVRQFIVENLVITFIGGALGFLLAIIALTLLAQSRLLQGEGFHFSYRVFVQALLYIMVFGLLSAVYPAWLMSRLDPVRALKGAVP
jgi:putative ABC transport system permease protein